MTELNMGNINDDETEELLILVREIANFKLYGDEIPFPGDGEVDDNDAVDCLNDLIARSRALLKKV